MVWKQGVTLDDRGGKAGVKKFIFWEKSSEMTPEERELFEEEFQYASTMILIQNNLKSKPLPKPRDFTMGFLSRINLIVKK